MSGISQDQGRGRGTGSGYRKIDCKESSGRGRLSPYEVHQSNVHCAKEGRPVLNLQSLNRHVSKAHFKLEDIRSLKDILHQNDFMAKLDLKEAYFSLPIAVLSRRFLQLNWKGKLLQFICLPFRLSSAPFVSRNYSSSLGERAGSSLPDVPGRHVDPRRVQGRVEWQFSDLQVTAGHSGVRRERREICSKPHTRNRILGVHHQFKIDDSGSNKGEAEIPDFTMQEPAPISSNDISASRSDYRYHDLPDPSSPPGTPTLQGPTRAQKRSSGLHHSYDTRIPLSQRAKMDLRWWINHVSQWRSRQILTSQLAMIIESDASDLGWGAVCLSPKDSTGGVWNSQEWLLHINCKELLAAWLGLQCYARDMRNCHVHLKIDNTAAVTYINRMGGAPSRDLCQLALKMWNWCIDHHITISAEHLPGSLNQTADRESRSKGDSSEWALDMSTFQQLMKKRGPCTVDLFASRLSVKLPTYYSWRSDPGATAVNALCQSGMR